MWRPKKENRGNNRGFSENNAKIVKYCPKTQNSQPRAG
jgi:hypothetical protein